MAKLNKTKYPKLPKSAGKVVAVYRSNEYLNVVCKNREVISFFLWDEISENYSHVLFFHLLN